jgi:DNA (cytosine-5)-methyltransferase 1
MGAMRVLELFSGLGGCAAALDGRAQVVAAVDQDAAAREVYALRYDHPLVNRNLHHVAPEWFAQFEADFWWMSPPCQPYTIRGSQKDLDDRRSLAFQRVAAGIAHVRPEVVAMENVPWFEGSAGEALLLGVLENHGYSVHTQILCPSELGVPARRRRYYLVASRGGLVEPTVEPLEGRVFRDYLDPTPAAELRVEADLMSRYAFALHVVDYDDDKALAACFTGAYGRSPVHAGSYVRQDGEVRRLSPEEIGRTLGLDELEFPEPMRLRKRYKLVGNSLSVVAVRSMLSRIPGLG